MGPASRVPVVGRCNCWEDRRILSFLLCYYVVIIIVVVAAATSLCRRRRCRRRLVKTSSFTSTLSLGGPLAPRTQHKIPKLNALYGNIRKWSLTIHNNQTDEKHKGCNFRRYYLLRIASLSTVDPVVCRSREVQAMHLTQYWTAPTVFGRTAIKRRTSDESIATVGSL